MSTAPNAKSSAPFVVAGVTGHTGKVVADTLLAAGHPVRVIVRKPEQGAPWQARGAQVAVASLDDAAALERALAGAAGVYLLLPPNPVATDFLGEKRAQIAAITAAVKAAKVPHVVLLSSVAAQHASGNGPIATVALAERELGAVTALTAVRAGYFLENYAGVLPMAKGDGVLPSFFPAGAPIPTVPTVDIGRVAAQALLDGPRGRRVIELSGAEDPSASDIAATLEKLLGRPVKVAEAPLDAVVPTFTSFGMSAHIAGLYKEMYAGFNAGRLGWEGGAAEAVRGTTSLADGLRALLG